MNLCEKAWNIYLHTHTHIYIYICIYIYILPSSFDNNLTRVIETLPRGRQALGADGGGYHRQGGNNGAARFETFATGVRRRLSYRHHPMPCSLATVIRLLAHLLGLFCNHQEAYEFVFLCDMRHAMSIVNLREIGDHEEACAGKKFSKRYHVDNGSFGLLPITTIRFICKDNTVVSGDISSPWIFWF